MVQNAPAMWETWVRSLGWHNPWWRACNTLQYSCLENLHGQRRLASYSTWGHKEWDMTERLNLAEEQEYITAISLTS